MQPVIAVHRLQKLFRVRKKDKGLRSYFFPKYEDYHAVKGVDFEVQRGERVAFIGPNGAGKSTTIKMLTGIFHPTSGSVEPLGMNPFKERKKTTRLFGAVFGQRSQLWPHLSPLKSFHLASAIYDLSPQEYKKQLGDLTELFQLDSILERPVRELSLGERMRCEIVASLLHQPEILFLDEPTIGLDIISKSAIRELISQRVRFSGMTVFLTSHDIGDIEKVCDRIILINQGKIMLDTQLTDRRKRYSHLKRIRMRCQIPDVWENQPGLVLHKAGEEESLFEADLSKIDLHYALSRILPHGVSSDLAIHDLPLEEIVRALYTESP
jgi:ABC-2 type transport system ATP-binding protein